MVTASRDGERSELRILHPFLTTPVEACLRRSVHGPQNLPLCTPPQPLHVPASLSPYIRVKQWGGVPHSTLVPR